MSYNLWVYGYGNPVNLTDPSGLQTISRVLANFVDEYDDQNKTASRWTNHEINMIHQALVRIAIAYANAYKTEAIRRNIIDPCLKDKWSEPLYHIPPTPKTIHPLIAFREIHGGRITIIKHNGFASDDLGADTWGTGLTYNVLDIYKAGYFDEKLDYLTRYGRAGMDIAEENYQRFITHEMGHLFDHAIGDEARLELGKHPRLITGSTAEANGFCGPKLVNASVLEGWQWRFQDNPGEYFADMFVSWTYGCWTIDPIKPLDIGQARSDFMNENMPKWIYEKVEGR